MQPRRRRKGSRVGVYSRLHRQQGNAAAPREQLMIRTTTLLVAALALAGQRVVFSADVRLVGRAAEGPGRVGHVGG